MRSTRSTSLETSPSATAANVTPKTARSHGHTDVCSDVGVTAASARARAATTNSPPARRVTATAQVAHAGGAPASVAATRRTQRRTKPRAARRLAARGDAIAAPKPSPTTTRRAE